MENRTERLTGNSWQALQKASCSATDNPYRHILMHTAGVIFMGVPFRGSHELLYRTCDLRAKIGRQLDNETSDYLVQLLRPENEESMGLLESFYQFVARDAIWFPICCFYETRDADYRAALERVADKLSCAIDDVERGQAGNDSDVLKMLEKELRGFTEGSLKMMVSGIVLAMHLPLFAAARN